MLTALEIEEMKNHPIGYWPVCMRPVVVYNGDVTWTTYEVPVLTINHRKSDGWSRIGYVYLNPKSTNFEFAEDLRRVGSRFPDVAVRVAGIRPKSLMDADISLPDQIVGENIYRIHCRMLSVLCQKHYNINEPGTVWEPDLRNIRDFVMEARLRINSDDNGVIESYKRGRSPFVTSDRCFYHSMKGSTVTDATINNKYLYLVDLPNGQQFEEFCIEPDDGKFCIEPDGGEDS